ncbi:MAG: hypothetical protein N2645_08485 [Clostridia bacterium]|nr:hypothetical protein [Clostridia bacterium]
MILKKYIPLIFVSALICISIPIFATVFANRGSEEKPYDIVQNLNKEDYAGSYVDDEGKLNVNMIDGKNIKEQFKNYDVKYHNAKYSLKYLEDIINKLNEKMIELGISSMGVSEKDNKVYVYLKSLEESKIKKIKQVVDSLAIEFVKEDPNLSIQF